MPRLLTGVQQKKEGSVNQEFRKNTVDECCEGAAVEQMADRY